jgi:hypothetical protein
MERKRHDEDEEYVCGREKENVCRQHWEDEETK